MKIDIWKRPWLAVLLLFLCFLLVGYFERQDQELFERMAPFTEAMRRTGRTTPTATNTALGRTRNS